VVVVTSHHRAGKAVRNEVNKTVITWKIPGFVLGRILLHKIDILFTIIVLNHASSNYKNEHEVCVVGNVQIADCHGRSEITNEKCYSECSV